MTPEATWLLIATALAVLYGAGWIGWKLRGLSDDHVRPRVSEETRARLAAMQEDDR